MKLTLLQLYADFPFRILYQDQFDRFSAPIENRYDREDVEGWLTRSGPENRDIVRGSGWREKYPRLRLGRR